MDDTIRDVDHAMKKLPPRDVTRIFWEIITGQRPPQKLDEHDEKETRDESTAV